MNTFRRHHVREVGGAHVKRKKKKRIGTPCLAFVWPCTLKDVGLRPDYWVSGEDTFHRTVYERLSRHVSVHVIMPTENISPRIESYRDVTYCEYPADQGGDCKNRDSSHIVRMLHDLQPDLITLYSPFKPLSLHCLKSGPNSCSYVLHDNSALPSTQAPLEDMAHLLSKVHLAISHSPSLEERIRRIFGQSLSTVVLPSGVNCDNFSPVDCEKKIDCIWIGLSRTETPFDGSNKNPESIIPITQFGSPFRIDVIGEGPQIDALSSRIEGSPGNHELISFLGWVDQVDLPMFLNRAKVFLCTSLFDAAPRAVSEAMSCGLPIVGFDSCEGTEQQIIHNVNGFRCSTPEDFSCRIHELLESDVLRAQMGKKSRKIAVAGFNRDTQADNLEKTYLNLMEKNGA